MSAYNLLNCQLKCPKCGVTSIFELETKFGSKSYIEYEIGDKVQWCKRDSINKGGRPEGGNIIEEGYAECESCGKDFFVNVEIKKGFIESVSINDKKKGFI